jgi:hypothetical protein
MTQKHSKSVFFSANEEQDILNSLFLTQKHFILNLPPPPMHPSSHAPLLSPPIVIFVRKFKLLSFHVTYDSKERVYGAFIASFLTKKNIYFCNNKLGF